MNTPCMPASIRDVTERREQENKPRRQHAELIEAKLSWSGWRGWTYSPAW